MTGSAFLDFVIAAGSSAGQGLAFKPNLGWVLMRTLLGLILGGWFAAALNVEAATFELDNSRSDGDSCRPASTRFPGFTEAKSTIVVRQGSLANDGGPSEPEADRFPTNWTGIDANINRPDEDHIHGPTATGYYWDAETAIQSGHGFLDLTGNSIVFSGTAQNGTSFITTIFEADQETHVTLQSAPRSGETVFLFYRVQFPGTSNLNAYYFGYNGNGNLVIGCLVGDIFCEELATGRISPLVNGDKIGAQVHGATLSMWYFHEGAWTKALTVMDRQVTGPGYVGLETQGAISQVKMSDFRGGNVRGK